VNSKFASQLIVLYKTIVSFYLLCFGLYIFFTRQPDYADGEFTAGTVHFIKDSSSQTPVAKANFKVDTTLYTIDAAYSFRHLKEGQKVSVIYETSNPLQAAVYSWWGYWITWKELLASILIPFGLLYIAKSVTGNPTPEGLIGDIETNRPERRKKYN
jgi:hypothetical protein